MKAAVFRQYGSPEVVHIEEIKDPTPKPNQILIKVKASTVTSADARIRRADPWLVRLMYGFTKPKYPVLGVVFAGKIVSVGSEVTNYQIGQRVYGLNDNFLGGHGEYVVINQDNPMGIIPDQMSYTDASSIAFGATTAIYFLQNLELKGKTLLLNGASGAVGTNILQIATSEGAIITAVCSTKNIELVKSLGAKEVIDYSTTNLDSHSQEYDIVIDCVNNIGMSKIAKYAKKDGLIILISGMLKELLFARLRIKKAKVIVGTAQPTDQIYQHINTLYTEKKLQPIIDQVLPLSSIIQAHRLVDSWRKVGNIVISIDTEM